MTSIAGPGRSRAVGHSTPAQPPERAWVIGAEGSGASQVVAGKPLQIIFGDDATPYGWNRNSIPANTRIEVRYRIDQGPWVSKKLSSLPASINDGGRALKGQVTLKVPTSARDRVEYYFDIVPGDGSAKKPVTAKRVPFANFTAKVIPAPTSKVVFDKNFNNPEGATLKAGTTFQLDYDPARLATLFRDTPRTRGWGNRTVPDMEKAPGATNPAASILWQAVAHVRFVDRNDRVVSESEFELRKDKTSVVKPLIQVPAGAVRMETWFTTRLANEAALYPEEYGLSRNTSLPHDSDADNSRFSFPVVN